jgi:hypothetical protein
MNITKLTPQSHRDASLGGALAGDVGGVIGATTVTGIDGIPLVGTLADGETWVYDAGSGTMVPGTTGAVTTGFVPTYIGPSETFTVPANRQALYAMTIDCEGILDVEGFLLEVA